MRLAGGPAAPYFCHMALNALLIAMNLAVVAILAGVAYFLNWSGPGFAAGAVAGGIVMAVAVRLKIGYWP